MFIVFQSCTYCRLIMLNHLNIIQFHPSCHNGVVFCIISFYIPKIRGIPSWELTYPHIQVCLSPWFSFFFARWDMLLDPGVYFLNSQGGKCWFSSAKNHATPCRLAFFFGWGQRPETWNLGNGWLGNPTVDLYFWRDPTLQNKAAFFNQNKGPHLGS